jgi:hypothetical protein
MRFGVCVPNYRCASLTPTKTSTSPPTSATVIGLASGTCSVTYTLSDGACYNAAITARTVATAST